MKRDKNDGDHQRARSGVDPGPIRRELGLDPGTPLVTSEDGQIVLETREQLVHRIQATATADRPDGECVVDELIAERRLEAQGEHHMQA